MDIGNVRCPECGKPMTPVACTCSSCRLRLEGSFTISILSLLPAMDQALMIAFVRSFGSIKKIQEILGVSYPTARMRIAGIIERLDDLMKAPETRENEVLTLLSQGDISFREAIERL
jgi:hypothetical protein